MKNRIHFVLALIIVFFVCTGLQAQSKNYSVEEAFQDTLSDTENGKSKSDKERLDFSNSHSRYIIKLNSVFASLDTKISFELPNGILSANLGLEENLGLPDSKNFFSGSFLYRFTISSAIYAQYYGLNRSADIRTDQEYIFVRDTIPAGTEAMTYFNTQVLSVGYMYTILKDDPDAFLGVYFNIYIMNLDTGIKSDIGDINSKVNVTIPLPNFGIVGMFKLNNWLHLDGEIGYFALHTESFGGSIFTLNGSLVFRVARWLGISLSYQEFNVMAFFPTDGINTEVNYNFRGPALGVSVNF